MIGKALLSSQSANQWVLGQLNNLLSNLPDGLQDVLVEVLVKAANEKNCTILQLLASDDFIKLIEIVEDLKIFHVLVSEHDKVQEQNNVNLILER